MDYERYDVIFRKERLFDYGRFSLCLGSALALYSAVPFVMRENLESLVNQGSVNPANSFLNEAAQDYLISGSYLIFGGIALMGLGACLLSRSHRILIPPVKEEIYE
ncbi:hypothetical protein HOD05_02550 [Candidatus Woesearchaeota archaeon]|jgi:hypothetical protein|nr:hypothetical protein [Candidatus Woesearchaeota archaeon]MBT4150782.1 hypothetical protein [Candidatus Woesearchaeota archaeon]MBT4247068.1 hypothetical protein [Candidatus Woesearchaeota archaeon]MBT4434077.1 hypothetical protein [Candidatus Woesearchaeota archaeon]MBT7332576.1 hypothetical protein [Candidatus Woesearchaeota archaeon]